MSEPSHGQDLTKLLPNASASISLERKTVAGKFKMEMRTLVDDTLAPSAGHFIRCIKVREQRSDSGAERVLMRLCSRPVFVPPLEQPNNVAQRFKLDDAASMELTLSQLDSCGVLEAAQARPPPECGTLPSAFALMASGLMPETAQISAAGFPNRVDYHTFVHAYAFTEPLFTRHLRQRFVVHAVSCDAAAKQRRLDNLAVRFPTCTKEQVSAALDAQKGHAGRATKQLKQLALKQARLPGSNPRYIVMHMGCWLRRAARRAANGALQLTCRAVEPCMLGELARRRGGPAWHAAETPEWCQTDKRRQAYEQRPLGQRAVWRRQRRDQGEGAAHADRRVWPCAHTEGSHERGVISTCAPRSPAHRAWRRGERHLR
jgi:hypothetical protein